MDSRKNNEYLVHLDGARRGSAVHDDEDLREFGDLSGIRAPGKENYVVDHSRARQVIKGVALILLLCMPLMNLNYWIDWGYIDPEDPEDTFVGFLLIGSILFWILGLVLAVYYWVVFSHRDRVHVDGQFVKLYTRQEPGYGPDEVLDIKDVRLIEIWGGDKDLYIGRPKRAESVWFHTEAEKGNELHLSSPYQMRVGDLRYIANYVMKMAERNGQSIKVEDMRFLPDHTKLNDGCRVDRNEIDPGKLPRIPEEFRYSCTGHPAGAVLLIISLSFFVCLLIITRQAFIESELEVALNSLDIIFIALLLISDMVFGWCTYITIMGTFSRFAISIKDRKIGWRVNRKITAFRGEDITSVRIHAPGESEFAIVFRTEEGIHSPPFECLNEQCKEALVEFAVRQKLRYDFSLTDRLKMTRKYLKVFDD